MIATAASPTSSHPKANVLFDGFRTALDRHPESTEIVCERRNETFRSLNPRNTLQEWFSDDVALMQIRLEHVARIERRERDRFALRAESFWDDDRRLLAEELGERLAKRPARVVKQLRATPQGCDWIGERWGLLLEISRAGRAWNDRQKALALDLLGTPTDLREDAVTARLLADPAGLAEAEIAALREQKVQVADSDALDRQLAMADMVNPTTPEFRDLKRYEAGLIRRMKWAMGQLELIPKYAEPHFDLLDRRERLRAAAVQATPKPEPEPEPEPESEPESSARSAAVPPTPEMQAAPRSHRPDPNKLRARADQKRRRDRLDR